MRLDHLVIALKPLVQRSERRESRARKIERNGHAVS